jgi:hypothetical protein
MGGACRLHGAKDECIECNGSDDLEGLSADERIILKLILHQDWINLVEDRE